MNEHIHDCILMDHKFLTLGCLLLGVIESALSQGGIYGYTVDVPADPRSVAMGESFVALPSDPAALMYNPAGLAGLKGMSVSYSQRSLDWVGDGWKLYSINATVATSIGVFAAQYNRKSLGTMSVTTSESPDGDGTTVNLYSYNFTLGYALSLHRGPTLGVSAKYFDAGQTVSGPSSGLVFTWTSTPAYLFDFGITYTLPPLHSQTTIEDSITAGMSYQNVGTHWKAEIRYLDPTGTPSMSQEENALPLYFRIGVSYAMGVRPPQSGGLSPFAAVFSGEFRSLQNPSFPYTATGSNAGTSFWGAGLECTIYEILSLRGGVSFRPYTDFEGERDRAAFRYGAAIHLPLQKIGVDVPFSASFQYAVVPLNQLDYYSQTSQEKSSLPVFSLDIQYTGAPW